MKISNSFGVDAPPEEVCAYLLDVNKVVGCVPGAELGQIVDSSTFSGTLKIKVGAVAITYKGTAHIENTEELDDRVVVHVQAKGREVGGSGAVFAKVAMTVSGTGGGPGGGSTVSIDADLTVGGRIAQFGSKYIEDISTTMVRDMATCIGAHLRRRG